MNAFNPETEPLVYICLAILGASPAADLSTGNADNQKKKVTLSRYQLRSKLNDRLKLINSDLSIGRAYNLFKNMIKYNLIIVDYNLSPPGGASGSDSEMIRIHHDGLQFYSTFLPRVFTPSNSRDIQRCLNIIIPIAKFLDRSYLPIIKRLKISMIKFNQEANGHQDDTPGKVSINQALKYYNSAQLLAQSRLLSDIERSIL